MYYVYVTMEQMHFFLLPFLLLNNLKFISNLWNTAWKSKSAASLCKDL